MTLAAYLNSQFSVLQELDFFIRILAACLCGACIGIERSRRLKEAGIRTHVIVCCAAALLMIVSKYGFADLTSTAGEVFNGTRGADPARVAAQVVSGISFLGAGVIFKHGNTIKGLTTAAGIWATARIGLAIGSGMFVTIVGEGGLPEQFADLVTKCRIQILDSTMIREEDGSISYDISLRAPHDVTMRAVKSLLEAREIHSVNCQPCS